MSVEESGMGGTVCPSSAADGGAGYGTSSGERADAGGWGRVATGGSRPRGGRRREPSRPGGDRGAGSMSAGGRRDRHLAGRLLGLRQRDPHLDDPIGGA